VETIAQALKLPYAAILLEEGEGFRTAAAYGSPGGEPETLPLVYQRGDRAAGTLSQGTRRGVFLSRPQSARGPCPPG
jgi:hypothetical protein